MWTCKHGLDDGGFCREASVLRYRTKWRRHQDDHSSGMARHLARSTWNHPFEGREASMLSLVQQGKFHNQKGSHVTERGAKEVTGLLHPDP